MSHSSHYEAILCTRSFHRKQFAQIVGDSMATHRVSKEVAEEVSTRPDGAEAPYDSGSVSPQSCGAANQKTTKQHRRAQSGRVTPPQYTGSKENVSNRSNTVEPSHIQLSLVQSFQGNSSVGTSAWFRQSGCSGNTTARSLPRLRSCAPGVKRRTTSSRHQPQSHARKQLCRCPPRPR